MDMRLGGSLWHFAVPILHTLGISFCMATQSKDKVGKSQSPCASVEAFGTGMEVCGVIQKRTVQEIVSKTWKKEDELKQLKSELAALDRKIQLELASPIPEKTEKNTPNAAQIPQLVQKQENPHKDFVQSHIVIRNPGLTVPRENKGVKINHT